MILTINLWTIEHWPEKHGYTPGNEEETSRFRIGPLVIGWQLDKDADA